MKTPKVISDIIFKNIEDDISFRQNYIKSNWNKIVGDNLSKKSIPTYLKKDILYISVENSAWLQEMRFLKKNIINNTNLFLNGIYVNEINFKINLINKKNIEIKEDEDINNIDIENIVLEREDIYNIKKSLSSIKDNDLKLKLYNLISKNKKREKYLLNKNYKKCENCGRIFKGNSKICFVCENEKKSKIKNEIYYFMYNNPEKNYDEIKNLYNNINYKDFEALREKLKSKIMSKIDILIRENDYEKLKNEVIKYIKLDTFINDEKILQMKSHNLINLKMIKLEEEKKRQERKQEKIINKNNK